MNPAAQPASRILAATDLSAPARHAVDRAFRLAAQSGAELQVLHAMELNVVDSLRERLGGDLSGLKSTLKHSADEQLQLLVSDPARQHGVAARTGLEVGNSLSVIASAVETMEADLLVLGSRGASFLRHAMLGSTAARVLCKTVRCPTLVVKQPPHEDYRTVLVGVDFSPVSLALIRTAQRWAPEARLVLLHGFELPYAGMLWRVGIESTEIPRLINAEIESRREQLHELAGAAGLAETGYSALVMHGDPTQTIMAMEQEHDADLIVLGKHGSSMTEEFLLGSVTKHVLDQASGDVLVVADGACLAIQRAAP